MLSARHVRRGVLAGALLLGLVALFALLGPLLVDVGPLQQKLAAALQPPGGDYLLGADQVGRSILARLAYGARLSLGLGLAAVLVTATLGAAVGLLAAWLGGLAGAAVLRLADLIMACPVLIFVLVVAGLFGGGTGTILLGLCLAQWPGFARLAYVVARGEMASEHVEAARLLRFGARHVVVRHLLPAALPHLASTAALTLATNILAIASMGFLGVGLTPPTPEWGAMVADTTSYLTEAPHAVLAPAAAIFLATLGATLLGEGLAAGARPREGERA